MKVFISWSGGQSGKIADYLKDWIKKIIQSSDPWISHEIEKGKKWNAEISDQLMESKIGLICLTRDNLNEPWILFEAGAISKLGGSNVCTLLIGIKPSDITGPLSVFQHTEFNKEDIFSLLTTINNNIRACGEKELEIGLLKELFDENWQKLEKKVGDILKEDKKVAKEDIRGDREVIDEILDNVRQLVRNSNKRFDEDLEKTKNIENDLRKISWIQKEKNQEKMLLNQIHQEKMLLNQIHQDNVHIFRKAINAFAELNGLKFNEILGSEDLINKLLHEIVINFNFMGDIENLRAFIKSYLLTNLI